MEKSTGLSLIGKTGHMTGNTGVQSGQKTVLYLRSQAPSKLPLYDVLVASLLPSILILVTFSAVSCFTVAKGGCQGKLYAEAHAINRDGFSKGKLPLLRLL